MLVPILPGNFHASVKDEGYGIHPILTRAVEVTPENSLSATLQMISNILFSAESVRISVFSVLGFFFFLFFWNEMNFYSDEFQKINIGFRYKQIDLQMLQIYIILHLSV